MTLDQNVTCNSVIEGNSNVTVVAFNNAVACFPLIALLTSSPVMWLTPSEF
jgi:hypothetical protein